MNIELKRLIIEDKKIWVELADESGFWWSHSREQILEVFKDKKNYYFDDITLGIHRKSRK